MAALTPREWEVLHLVTEGRTTQEIAEALVVTKRAVDKHIGALLTKLQVESRTQLGAFVRRHHLESREITTADGGEIYTMKSSNLPIDTA